MIQFNELRIIDGELIIDISVKDLSYYENVTITGIKIDNQDTFSLNGPSENAFTVPGIVEGRTVRVSLNQTNFVNTEFSIENDLFFVYAIAGGIPSADTPCGMDNCYSLGVAANLNRLYDKGISYIKELNNTCSVPSGFTDFILKYKAFILSVKTCDYTQAIKFWKKFFSKDRTVVTERCGCHG